MVNHDDLLLWFRRMSLSERAQLTINQIRSSGPSRRVGGGKNNVSGRYPSRKMGVTIQFESHRVELAGIYEMEHDGRVLEYYDQPPPIKLNYKSANGKGLGVFHTPDFFVLGETEAGWEEWKTEEELKRLCARNPNRYCMGEKGEWLCPPGRAHAEELGFYYRVRSSAEIDATLQRNIQFLEDYLRGDGHGISLEGRDLVEAFVASMPGLSLAALMEHTQGRVAADTIFAMIASGMLSVDFSSALLAEPSRVRMYPADGTAADRSRDYDLKIPSPSMVTFRCGSHLTWDGRCWEVANVGDTAVCLLSREQGFAELPVVAAENLVREGRLCIASETPECGLVPTVRNRLLTAGPDDLRAANHRYNVVTQYLITGAVPAGADTPARTVFRWVARFRHAEATLGNGFAGLLPEVSRRGNRNSKLPAASLQLMLEHIETDYETIKQKSMYASWTQLKLACEAKCTAAPSYKTFCRAVGQRPILSQTLNRKGRRAAYLLEVMFWTLEVTTPRHGDRPFEIGHIDHTELDIELRCEATGKNLGRPWLTLLGDAFSRRILGLWLTFDPPSYRSCMIVLRDCVRRHCRLPQTLVVDGGREFQSTYFEALLARYECTKKTRPPAKARFGSVLERMFGTCNTQFVHNLQGNTQITREVRQVTASINPKTLATWNLADLNESLTEYLFEVYDQIEHPALGQSPRNAFARGLETGGLRSHRLIQYDRNFLLCTMPSTPKGTATVKPGRGIKIHYIYYWADAFREPELQRREVPVRYDPFDVGTSYAFCRNQWVECHSEYYSALRGRSEREIMLATAELRKRQRLHSAQKFTVTAKALASFLTAVEDHEELLQQRNRDRECLLMRAGKLFPDNSASTSFAPPVLAKGVVIPIDAVEIYNEL
jgi:transposase InsO family protein